MSERFVKMISELHEQRYTIQLQRLIIHKIPCGIFIGDSADVHNANNAIYQLINTGVNIKYIFLLNEEQKNYFNFDNIQILQLSEFASLATKPQCILTLDHSAFHYYFKKFGLETLLIAPTNQAESYYNYICHYLPEIFDSYNLLAEDESKNVFCQYIKARITNKLDDFRFAPEQQYWLEGFFPNKGDIVIDGGAYDGGTSTDFAMQGAKVYAFEMDNSNYKNCLDKADKYNFVIENMGLSSEESESSYISAGVGSSKHGMQGGATAHFIDIDTYIKRNNIPRVDYIKLDIEGAELDCLKGAAKTIVRCKPKMAISAYHKVEDIWVLANYIKSIRPDYEFKFRHYRIDVHDYILDETQKNILIQFGLELFIPNHCETVLYCR